ncbi:tetratricopeptide repeat protein [Candidatus Kuenenia stuttgartensis]|uniref:tetratricopeptide repeat protein n=1 Tax=Kuenenia stuttgartiensis TaxID=174633 RepID=UPI00146DCA6F|nr:tetratricopeptide repeat protein [Candidatus Kuenenia stuttgartiensis]
MHKKNRFDDAIKSYKKVLETQPDDPVLYNNLGAAYTETGKLDEAIAALKKSIQLNPKIPMSHKNLEFAYRKKGLIEDAEKELKLYEVLSNNTPQEK